MSNYNYEQEFDIKDIELREKQCKCDHPSFKCPLCGLYKDNLYNEYRAQIELLESLLDIDDKLLNENNIVHISLKELDINVIIKSMIEAKKRQYNSERLSLQDEV